MNLKLLPRTYQLEAAKKALESKKCVIVLPTGTGKTLIALIWLQELLKNNKIKKALVLEPTRILVEQTAKYFEEIGNLKVEKIYGVLPKEKRIELWKKSKIVVTTPETALNDIEYSSDFDCLIIDECHHAIGEDAYLKFLKQSTAEWKLGLSAFIPRKIRSIIETYIGEIFEWSAEHPEIKKYLPEWIGEVFEAYFNEKEYSLYRKIEEKYLSANNTLNKILLKNCLKYYSRDGLLALRETFYSSERINNLLKDLENVIFDKKLRELHKLSELTKILKIYEFTKCIIFVERVIVANKLYEILSKNYNVVVIKGKRHEKNIKEVLEKAKHPSTEIIISTSAGEEGVDLPSADLLVVWSNISNPIRFIQRHGRILRKTKETKFVTYIITPNTVDLDIFIDGLENVKKYIDININKAVLENLWKKSPRKKILNALEFPMPMDWIKEITGLPLSEIRKFIKKYCESGELFYIYTHLGKTYFLEDHIPKLYEEFKEYLLPEKSLRLKIKSDNLSRAISGNYEEIISKLKNKLPINNLNITIEEELENGIIKYHYLNYSFLIKNEEILEIVIKNACSKETLKIY